MGCTHSQARYNTYTNKKTTHPPTHSPTQSKMAAERAVRMPMIQADARHSESWLTSIAGHEIQRKSIISLPGLWSGSELFTCIYVSLVTHKSPAYWLYTAITPIIWCVRHRISTNSTRYIPALPPRHVKWILVWSYSFTVFIFYYHFDIQAKCVFNLKIVCLMFTKWFYTEIHIRFCRTYFLSVKWAK